MRSRGVVKQKKRFLIVLIYIFFGWKTRQWWGGHWLGREKTQWVPQRCFDPTTQTPRASALPTELQPALS